MKRVLFSFLLVACLSLPGAELSAKTCKPSPDSFYFGKSPSKRGNYFVAWRHGAPIIYFYRANQPSPKSVRNFEPLLIAAEFDKRKSVWVFYGKVPRSLVKTVHRHWEQHKTAYKACLGDYAWQNGNYYYAPYRMHRQNSPAYNWVLINPHKDAFGKVIIIKPKLKLNPRKKKRKKLKKRKERPASS